jgi:hypothetical protein
MMPHRMSTADAKAHRDLHPYWVQVGPYVATETKPFNGVNIRAANPEQAAAIVAATLTDGQRVEAVHLISMSITTSGISIDDNDTGWPPKPGEPA